MFRRISSVKVDLGSARRIWIMNQRFFSSGSQISCQFISNGLKFAAKLHLLHHGQQLHGQMLKSGNHDNNNLSLQNYLLNFYVKSKRVSDAFNLFDEMLVRDVVTWNTLICGLSSDVCLGFWCFKMMLMESSSRPDWITFTSLLRLCVVDTNETELTRVLHCLIIQLGFSEKVRVSTALVDTYGKVGLVKEARHVFNYAKERDLVSCNAMISCYVMNGFVDEGFELWDMMRREGGFIGDGFTFTSLFKSCACSGSYSNVVGEMIHGIVIKLSFGFSDDVVLATSLVDMYAKNQKIASARKVFDEMPYKTVVSWTTIIVGYGQCGDGIESFNLLNQMLRKDFHPDELTLSSVLSSCGNLALLEEISQVHAHGSKNGLSGFLSFGNALINAYFKSGSITCASKAFSSVLKPDIFSWTSIIAAYGFHGFCNKATELFERMLYIGVKPDKIAFLEVLSACSHGGLVLKGLHYYNLMLKAYKIVPDIQHNVCLVDLLGRAGLLNEAFNVLKLFVSGTWEDALGAFLGACKVHKNVEYANWAVEKLMDLDTKRAVNYRLVSNLYASTGLWSGVAYTRKAMKENCCDYEGHGCSWTQVGGNVSSFVSGDVSHPNYGQASFVLRVLYTVMDEDDRFATYN